MHKKESVLCNMRIDLGELSDSIKCSNIHIIGVAEKKSVEREERIYLKK